MQKLGGCVTRKEECIMHPWSKLVALAFWIGATATAGAQQEADTVFRPDVGSPRFVLHLIRWLAGPPV